MRVTGAWAPTAWNPRRDGRISTFAILSAASCVACALSALFPFSPAAPVQLDLVAALWSGLAAVTVWRFGSRLPGFAFHVGAAVGTVLISAIIANAATGAGVVITSFGYLCIALYAAHFFPRAALYAHLVLISAAFGAALLLNRMPAGRFEWIFVVAVVWGTALVLANLVDKLRRLAVTDPLTGLLNREGFQLMAGREVAMARRTGEPFTIALIDLDDFKQVNDRRGHAEGDRVLATVTGVWQRRLRAYDVLARQGGRRVRPAHAAHR